MNSSRSIDLASVLEPWLENAAEQGPVSYLEAVLAQTHATRQRPAWTFPGRWLPLDLAPAPLLRPAGVRMLLLLAAILALAYWALAAGGLERLPPPNGFARPGLVSLDMDHHIAVMNADGSGLRLLTSGDAADTSPVWSPDGTRLAFWRAIGNGQWSVLVADGSGTVLASVAVQARTSLPLVSGDPGWSSLPYALGAPSFLQWSPDSRRLAFSQDTNGIPGVWVVTADGSELEQIGDPDLPAADPYWSSDGTRIAFHGGSQVTGGGNGVYVMGADGTEVRRVSKIDASGYSFAYPQWQPGGELIAFIAVDAGVMRVLVVGSDGTGERDISAPSGEVNVLGDWIQRWSPDGSRIAFQRWTTARTNGQITIVDLADGAVLIPAGQPDANMGGPMWSPDGRTVSALLYDANTGASFGLVMLDATGHDPVRVAPAAGNTGGTSWQRLAP